MTPWENGARGKRRAHISRQLSWREEFSHWGTLPCCEVALAKSLRESDGGMSLILLVCVVYVYTVFVSVIDILALHLELCKFPYGSHMPLI